MINVHRINCFKRDKHHAIADVEKIFNQIVFQTQCNSLSFEVSYRSVYNLVMFVSDGYKYLYELLTCCESQLMSIKNDYEMIKQFKLLKDICLYPIKQDNGKDIVIWFNRTGKSIKLHFLNNNVFIGSLSLPLEIVEMIVEKTMIVEKIFV